MKKQNFIPAEDFGSENIKTSSSKIVYLDYAATTPLLPETRKAMHEAEEKFFANPSALHTPGHSAKLAIESVREKFAKYINCEPEEIIFTSGSTEANNTVINIFENQTVAIAAIEHHSLLEPARQKAGKFIALPVDKFGKVCYDESIWASHPSLISISGANNELGTIQDLEFWSKRAHENGAKIHSDLTQVLGKLKIDVKKLGLDYATFSAHKIGGPVGVGILYINKSVPFKPFMLGGSQENHRRAGTMNIVGIVGLGAALDYIKKVKSEEIFATKIKALRDELAERILAEIPGASLNTPIINVFDSLNLGFLGPASRPPAAAGGRALNLGLRPADDPKNPKSMNLSASLPNILNVSFAAAEGESIQLYLDAEDIIVSTGSACASGDLQPDHVLMAARHDAEVAHGSIRFSFGLSSSESDINRVMSVLPGIVKRLQSISTIKMKGENT